MAHTKRGLRDEMVMSLSDVIQSTSVKYDTVPFSIEEDYDTENDDDHPIDMSKSRRWSILDKLERRCHSIPSDTLIHYFESF
jgi:hypothetical protein